MDNYSYLAVATAILATSMIGVHVIQNKQHKRVRKVWSKKWHLRRDQGRGILAMLNKELLPEDPTAYRNFIRLNEKQFCDLLVLVEPFIKRQDTNMRECVSAQSRLEITLRYLATGETFRSLMFATRVHESTISLFIPEVCSAIITVLKEKYLQTPSTTAAWEIVSSNFNTLWNFPQCLGALDGRHIKFRPPRSVGSYYYNYKGHNSIVLLAMADALYRFTYVNMGVNGRISDGGVFRESHLSRAILNNSLCFPNAHELPGRNLNVPYVIVADDAFPLSTRILKPFPQRGLTYKNKIFNYRLSRARRVIENAFGILANRFRVLLNEIPLSPHKIELITLTCVALHNYLTTENGLLYANEAECTNDPQLPKIVQPQGCNRANNAALKVREEYMHYFCNEGKVEWQNEAILKHNM